MRHFYKGLALFLASVSTALHPPASQAATPKEVDTAISNAKAFLYAQQKNGIWETDESRVANAEPYSTKGGQWGGLTALTTYSLLAAGEDAQSDRMKPALAWLKKADINGVYALGFRAQIWPLLPPSAETRQLAKNDFQKLYNGLNRTGKSQHLYTYYADRPDPNSVDHSVSQLGVLGVWACAQSGIEVPDKYWAEVEKRWIADQKPDGGWTYDQNPRQDPNPEHNREQASMTSAGVATLFITQDFVHANEGARCAGNIQNPYIDKGVAWLAGHTDDWTDPIRISARGFSYVLPGYTLYGIERVGVASGLRNIGSVDWYQFGADWLIKNQGKDGSWGGLGSLPNTALCLHFLARGRSAVLINKLQYTQAEGKDAGKPGPWNQRPRDVANFTLWMGRQLERHLNWQIVNLENSADDLNEAPFLYISGNTAVSFSAEQKEKLKQYVRRGGMILANADCGGGASGNPFLNSLSKLCVELFPECGEFRMLPPTHPIYKRQQFIASKWKAPVNIRGLSNGLREFVILFPQDPGGIWHRQEITGAGREEAYQAAANVILYGTDKQPKRYKGESTLVKADPNIKATRTIKVARLKYNGIWDPEPAGWPRLAAQMHNTQKLDLDVQPIELGKDSLDGFQVAHLTGTTKLVATAEQKQALKKFAESGGTLLIDANGPTSDFAISMDGLLGELFPKGLGDPLPKTDPVFTKANPTITIRFRSYVREVLPESRDPQLCAIKIGQRNAVYYSREDLSAGLVGQLVDGITGYDPESSTAITTGVLLLAAPK